MTDAPTTSPLPFSTAAALWFQEHKRYIKPNTAKAYNDALKPLCKFLGDKPLNEIELCTCGCIRICEGIELVPMPSTEK